MTDYGYDLGSYSCPITTSSPDAQLWFDRGLNWVYGFNHDEAIACFQRALEVDPDCAMAHWGIAYAAGPNYNMPWELYDDRGRAKALARAYDATQEALARTDSITDAERALIDALPARYPQRDITDGMNAWDLAYANQMREVQAAFPDHLDIRSVFAESLMNLTPWKMWDLRSGTPAEGAYTDEVTEVLETALNAGGAAMAHPGLLHLYVHLMEMSPHPEKALKAGDVLRTLMPDAGHLVHMPTHIDVLCGDYEKVVRWNQKAVEADLIYYNAEGAFNVYTGYRQHDYHFVVYGAMFLGQMEPALAAIRGMAETVPEAMLRIPSPPMADFFESYMGLEPHVLVRFGRWEELIQMQPPEDQELYVTLTANTHYARTVAFAALGRVEEAEAEEQVFLAACDRVPKSRLMHNNTVVDLMEIAKQMARGEIEYRKGNYDIAYDHLRRGVELEDNLPYDEPWGWMQPVRHALGALLFEQGHVAEAEAVYREDLGLGGQLSRATVHPDNVWSLRGLYDCLKSRDETVEIVHIKQKLDLALARADAALAASCFCAQAAMKGAA
ncbi:MAG: tetratricopeptide repeat protein [Paracoccaceae bacterium]